MVASRAPFGRNSLLNQNKPSVTRRAQPAASDSVTSGLISQLAVAALKLRLKSQTHVSCDVSASSSNLILRGQVGPVTVKGRGWGSSRGLTCRVIEATVNQCELDMSRVLSNQKLVLTVPGKFLVADDVARYRMKHLSHAQFSIFTSRGTGNGCSQRIRFW
jgi:hypothetical protein